MQKPRILQLLHSMHVGGAEVLAAALARRLQSHYDFVFACLDDIGELGCQLREEGFALELLGRSKGIDWSCVRRLKRVIKARGIDLIHAHQYTPFFYAVSTGVAARRPAVLFTEHGRFFPDYPRKKRILFNRALLRKKDRVIGVGEAVRQALISNEGIAAERTEVIYNGIDVNRFASSAVSAHREQVRDELGIGRDAYVGVLVGRLDYLKDHSTAIRTAERVAHTCPDFRLLLIGDGPERSKIEAEIAEKSLGKVVTLLGTRHDVPRLLHAADVCFLSSISEGIPLTLIEGMAAGIPVVATAVGGVGEVVIDHETGLLAPSGDDRLLADCLIQLARDEERRREMGECGRLRASQMFSEAKMHQRYRDLYNEMLAPVISDARSVLTENRLLD